MDLRPHQRDILRAVYPVWKRARRVMVQLCPGGGKTLIGQRILSDAASRGRECWFFAPRRGLVEQTAQKFRDYGSAVSVVMAGHRYALGDNAIRVASIDTVLTREIAIGENAVCLVDECHITKIDDAVNGYPQSVWWGGLTGTPKPSHVWDEIVCGPQPSALVAAGYLAEHETWIPDGPAPDHAAICGDPVSTWCTEARGLRTLAFCRSQKHARAHAAALVDVGVRAVALTCDDDDRLRAETLARLYARDLDVVANVGLYREGTDLPWLECVHDIAPSDSVESCVQAWARLWRVDDTGTTRRKLHIDQVWNIVRHGMPQWDRAWSLTKTKDNGAPLTAPPLYPCATCRYLRGGPVTCKRCGAPHDPASVVVVTAPGMLRAVTEAREEDLRRERAVRERAAAVLRRCQARAWEAVNAGQIPERMVWVHAAKLAKGGT